MRPETVAVILAVTAIATVIDYTICYSSKRAQLFLLPGCRCHLLAVYTVCVCACVCVCVVCVCLLSL